MTSHELARKLLELPDTDLKGKLCLELSEKTLSERSYKYPVDYIDGSLELGDTSYSDNETFINLYVKECDLGL